MPLKRKDGVVMGGLLGAAVTMPKIANWVVTTIDPLITGPWRFAGEFTLPLYGILLGLLVGYIIDST